MGTAGLKNFARIAALLVAVAALTPVAASAGGHEYDGWSDAYPGAISAPIQGGIYAFPGAYAFDASTPWCYTVPILAVYQFPAVLYGQPGSDVAYLRTNPAVGILGGRPYLYHR